MKMFFERSFITLFAALLLLFPAATKADSLAVDSRIRTLVYGENEVFRVVVEHGYQANIELGNNEKIITLSIGNPVAFKVSPAGNRLFIKSLKDNAHTNMTVVTNRHAYQFELSSIVESDEDLVYVMRFYYPEEDLDEVDPSPVKNYTGPAVVKDTYNFNYSVSGNARFTPLKMFDDGRQTFFQFSPGITPTIHGIAPNGTETQPLPARNDGEYMIVPLVASQFSLRNGAEVLCVFNESGGGMPAGFPPQGGMGGLPPMPPGMSPTDTMR